MLHPSYSDLIEVVNSGVEEGEAPVVQSRYSIVIATAKRARQLISGAEPLVEDAEGKKPLSIAVEELYSGKIKILGEDEEVGGDMLELSEDEDSEVMNMENADETEEAAEKAEDMAADESEDETEAYIYYCYMKDNSL